MPVYFKYFGRCSPRASRTSPLKGLRGRYTRHLPCISDSARLSQGRTRTSTWSSSIQTAEILHRDGLEGGYYLLKSPRHGYVFAESGWAYLIVLLAPKVRDMSVIALLEIHGIRPRKRNTPRQPVSTDCVSLQS